MQNKKSNEEFEKFSIKLTTEYCKKFPKKITKKTVKGIKRSLTKEEQIQNIKKAFERIIKPNETTTVPDELVSDILEKFYSHKKNERQKIQKQYQDQKQTEMKIGELLEKYIASKGKDFGWAFSSSCIQAVDFIKKDGSNWTTLQIKNSDNTENSSASAIRNNTTILKWFRRHSKKGTYNWDEFPDEELKNEMSEKDFREFALETFKKN